MKKKLIEAELHSLSLCPCKAIFKFGKLINISEILYYYLVNISSYLAISIADYIPVRHV